MKGTQEMSVAIERARAETMAIIEVACMVIGREQLHLPKCTSDLT